MACPKKAKSKSKRNTRRSHHAISAATIVSCPNCGETKLLHRVCSNCGYYKGREVVRYEEE